MDKIEKKFIKKYKTDLKNITKEANKLLNKMLRLQELNYKFTKQPVSPDTPPE